MGVRDVKKVGNHCYAVVHLGSKVSKRVKGKRETTDS